MRRARRFGIMRAMRVLTFLAFLLAAPGLAPAATIPPAWPAGEALFAQQGRPVAFPSASPFTPREKAAGRAPGAEALGTLFLPSRAPGAPPPPGIVLLHGSSGVLGARELTYGRQFAAMGIAALVVDAFAARREMGTGFTERLLNITESMLIADAYAGLAFLAAEGHADPRCVAPIGFSYGGMATMYALNAGAARIFSPSGLRFAAHAALYGPCIASFSDERTTGAPLLMLYGTADELMIPSCCGAAAQSFRRGGRAIEVIAYVGAAHRGDGGRGPVRVGSLLGGCALRLERDGSVRDENTGLAMSGAISRRIILGLCVERQPYLIAADEAVRARSNADLGRFLARALGLE
jgi:dienelactone hydrolase